MRFFAAVPLQARSGVAALISGGEMRRKLSLLAVVLGVLLVALGATLAWSGKGHSASAANPTPTVIATVPVGSGPWGVAVNPSTNRIYTGNQLSNNVSVIDGGTKGGPLGGLEPGRGGWRRRGVALFGC